MEDSADQRRAGSQAIEQKEGALAVSETALEKVGEEHHATLRRARTSERRAAAVSREASDPVGRDRPRLDCRDKNSPMENSKSKNQRNNVECSI